MLKGKRLAVLGAGKLGETLIRGLLDARAVDASRVTVTAARRERAEGLARELGLTASPSNREAAEAADLVLLSVKPQQVSGVLSEIAEGLRPSQLIISVAASVSTAFIEKRLGRPIPYRRPASCHNPGPAGTRIPHERTTLPGCGHPQERRRASCRVG